MSLQHSKTIVNGRFHPHVKHEEHIAIQDKAQQAANQAQPNPTPQGPPCMVLQNPLPVQGLVLGESIKTGVYFKGSYEKINLFFSCFSTLGEQK